MGNQIFPYRSFELLCLFCVFQGQMIGDYRKQQKLSPRRSPSCSVPSASGQRLGTCTLLSGPKHRLYQRSSRAPFDWLLIHKKMKSLEVIFRCQLLMRQHLRPMFSVCGMFQSKREKSLNMLQSLQPCFAISSFLHMRTTYRKEESRASLHFSEALPDAALLWCRFRADPKPSQAPTLFLTLLQRPSFLPLPKVLPGSSFAAVFRDTRCDFYLYLMLLLLQPLPNTSKIYPTHTACTCMISNLDIVHPQIPPNQDYEVFGFTIIITTNNIY